MRRIQFLTFCFLWLIASSGAPEPPPEHRDLGADGEPLRSHFNADVGKVRAVLLAAPT
ncbi:MAG: hypothetical protein V3T72_01290 [Thermoanaerobaculia bacterium]